MAPPLEPSRTVGSVDRHQSENPQRGNELGHPLHDCILSVWELFPGDVGNLLKGGVAPETVPDERTQLIETDPLRVPGPMDPAPQTLEATGAGLFSHDDNSTVSLTPRCGANHPEVGGDRIHAAKGTRGLMDSSES